MTEDSSIYLRKRAQQERDLASARQDETRIANAHRAVAEEYERTADQIDQAEIAGTGAVKAKAE